MSSRFKLFYISFVSGLGWYVWGGSRRERERERERETTEIRRSFKTGPIGVLVKVCEMGIFFF
jgi:hypothetical protein